MCLKHVTMASLAPHSPCYKLIHFLPANNILFLFLGFKFFPQVSSSVYSFLFNVVIISHLLKTNSPFQSSLVLRLSWTNFLEQWNGAILLCKKKTETKKVSLFHFHPGLDYCCEQWHWNASATIGIANPKGGARIQSLPVSSLVPLPLHQVGSLV